MAGNPWAIVALAAVVGIVLLLMMLFKRSDASLSRPTADELDKAKARLEELERQSVEARRERLAAFDASVPSPKKYR